MDTFNLIATCTYGLEAVVKRELQKLGIKTTGGSPGKVEFSGTFEDIAKANLWLRSGDRVLIKMGEYKVETFDELFELTKALPWEDWITEDGEFNVKGKARDSILGSVRACQAIVKKAVVERLKEAYNTDWFEEDGPAYTIRVALLKDVATLTLDTSGSGLTKRGYRVDSVTAPLKETLAAGLVQLSYYYPDRYLMDPMCGSGTILIEAALWARNIAPGLDREFVAEEWPAMPSSVWADVRAEAKAAIKHEPALQIFGSDRDPDAINAAQRNAASAGVGEGIVFEHKELKDIWVDRQYGVLISNPPYGVKMGDFKEMNQTYIEFNQIFKKKLGWSIYILTADEKFPDYFKRAWPDRNRKLTNGPLQVRYYQYQGERPPRIEE